MKTKYLMQTAAERGKQDDNKTQPKTPDSLRREASQAASAAPTLCYGPAGDSAPRLRLKAAGMAERFPFGPASTARMSRFGPWCDAIEHYQMRYKLTG